jgi:hypothetical protein
MALKAIRLSSGIEPSTPLVMTSTWVNVVISTA